MRNSKKKLNSLLISIEKLTKRKRRNSQPKKKLNKLTRWKNHYKLIN